MIRIAVVLFGAGLIASPIVSLRAQSRANVPEWRYFGADKGFTRYSPIDQINRSNVASLRMVWRQSAVDPAWKKTYPELRISGNLRSTPIMVNGVLYAPNAVGFIRAIDPGSGATIWEQRPFAASQEETAGQSPRGVDYWKSATGNVERLVIARGEYLYSIDVKEGAFDRAFGDQGRVSLHWDHSLAGRFNWTAGPIVANDVVVIAGNTGGAGDGGVIKEATAEDVRGYDVRTGKLLWTFHVVQSDGEGDASWAKESWRYSGDLGSWCCVTADEELGLVFIPLTAPTAAAYGGHRPGDNLFSNTLVALDARTGKKVWHFQMVHHDLWEYDTVGPAILGDITVGGRRIKAVMQPSKTGFLYVFDRKTGEPVWPIVERPVPQSTVPGEVTSATQPFPTKPPPFDRQGFTEDDLIDFTPELRARARAAVKDFVLGPLFTPPSLRSEDPGGKRGTLTMPGGWGSGNWNTGAFDPETAVYYAISHTQPGVRGVVKTTDPQATMDYAGQARGAQPPAPSADGTPAAAPPEQQNPNAQGPWPGPQLSLDGFPLFKPPYGRITAIDMNRGEHVWMKPIGDGPRNHPLVKDLNLPPLGIPARPAPLLTKSLLFLGEGSDAMPGTNREGMWGRMFRAYDKSTGQVLWETELPAGTTGAPMTYLHQGKQYVVVAIGGREHPAEWIAFGLP